MNFQSIKKYIQTCLTPEFFAILAILLLGAYLRLYKIADYLTFLGDEGRDVLIVKRMIVDHVLTFLGPTASVGGFFLGPMYYYFMAPFLWLFRLDPVGPAVMVALFGIATIYLVYHVGKTLFHPVVGFLAAGLYAVSPVVIAYSRSSWNPNLVPFFSLLFIYVLWRITAKKRPQEMFYLGLIAGLGIQFHYLFGFLFVVAIVWLLLFERRKNFLPFLARGILGGVITLSPFILFELRHGFPNTRSLINFLLYGKETGISSGASFFDTVGDVSFRSFGRLLVRLPDAALWNGFAKWQVSAWVSSTNTLLFISLLLLGLYAISYANSHVSLIKGEFLKRFSVSRETALGYVVLLIWFGLSVLLFGLYHKGIYDYYFGIFFAFPFLATALILWHLMRSKIGLVLAVCIWGGLIYFNWQGRPFIYAPNRQLEQTKIIARAALDMVGGKPYNFALITATNSDHAYRYFFEIWGQKPVTIENTAIDPQRKTVTSQLIIICEDPNCHPLGNSLWEVAGFGRAEIAEEKNVSVLKVVRLVPYKGDK